MMLIECPECKKQISDKAESCPNCGCPIDKFDMDNCCIINGKSYNLDDIIALLPKVGNKDTDISPIYLIGCIGRKTQLDWEHSKKLVDIIIDSQKIPDSFDGKVEVRREQPSNTPKCPICQSTNLTKISTTSKAVKIATFGIYGAGDIGKTWKCNDCGSKF